ncbi:MAG: capsid cement protein [Cyanobacteria bacterium J06638_20]
MSFQKALAVTLQAASGADLAQGRFVDIGASGLTTPTANGDAVGVTAEAYDDSEVTAGRGSPAIPVLVEGIVEVEASAAIAVGADVATGADGRAATAASGNVVLGKCVLAAGAAGEFASVLLTKRGSTAP